MRGYYRDREPYLTGSHRRDNRAFYVLLFLLFNASMVMTTWAVWAKNPVADWKDYDVLMSGPVLLWLTLGLGSLFYVLQMLRMAYYYVAGWENWMADEPRIDTFEVHPGIDIVRGLIVCIVNGVAVGIINIVMQNTHARDTALQYGTIVTTSFALITVVTPMIIFAMVRVRDYRLRQLETYRQLGGEG